MFGSKLFEILKKKSKLNSKTLVSNKDFPLGKRSRLEGKSFKSTSFDLPAIRPKSIYFFLVG